MKKILIIILSCFMIFLLVGCGGDSSSTSSSTSLKTGQSITLSDDVLVCSSKENVDKMISYMQQKNTLGQNEMLSRGEATILSTGTIVNVVKVGIVVEIETEGGQSWYAPYEMFE